MLRIALEAASRLGPGRVPREPLAFAPPHAENNGHTVRLDGRTRVRAAHRRATEGGDGRSSIARGSDVELREIHPNPDHSHVEV